MAFPIHHLQCSECHQLMWWLRMISRRWYKYIENEDYQMRYCLLTVFFVYMPAGIACIAFRRWGRFQLTHLKTSDTILDSAQSNLRLWYSSHTGPHPRPFLLCRIWADKKVIRRNLSSVYVLCLYFLSKPQNDLQLLFVETLFMRSFVLNSIVRGGSILVSRGCAPFRQHQESRPLGRSNTGSPRLTDFPSLCACSQPKLTIWLAENTKWILCACSEN